MNGLKYIRTQCNLSLNNVAQALGVSRQIVSAWENGKKDIPNERKQQLSKYFGIDTKYFDEIDEVQKKEILGTAMYRWNQNGNEFFLFRPDEDSQTERERLYTYEQKERKNLLSDELKEKKHQQKEMIQQIEQQLEGMPWYTLNDRIASINRGVKYYDCCAKNYKIIYDQPTSRKMSYYYRALEVMEALLLAFGGEIGDNDDMAQYFAPDDYTYRIDLDFVQECADMIKEHMMPIVEKLDDIDEKVKRHHGMFTDSVLQEHSVR